MARTSKRYTYPIADSLAGLRVEATEITNGHIEKRVDERGKDSFYWQGLGYFDILAHGISENLKIQYDSSRITGEMYANAYSQLITAALDTALKLALQNKELELKVAEVKLKERELNLKEELNDEEVLLNKLKQENIRAQTKVYDRQIEGFNDNLKIKMFQAQLDSFGMMFSSGMLDFDQNASAFPKALKSSALSETYDLLYRSATANWGEGLSSKHNVEKRVARAGLESEIAL